MLRTYISSVNPGKRVFPVSQHNLAGFITHMYSGNYASSTILSTVSAVSYSHKIIGLTDPADNFYIKKLLLGIKKRTSTIDSRRPIDLCMLGQLTKATKAVIPNKFSQLCIAAMFMLAFHGFLRIGEICVRSGVLSGHVIQRSDIEVVPGHKGGSNTSLRLTIRHAKHQQVNRHVVLEIMSQSINCPVKLLCNYLHIRGSAMGPLFVFPDKSPMSRSYFASQLSACLSHAGYNPSLYKCHSFRIGAVTTAATRGFTDVQIQAMGRWKSTAFRRYIRIPMMKL